MILFLFTVWTASTAVGQQQLEQCRKNFQVATDVCLEQEQSANPNNYDLSSFSGRASLASDTYNLNFVSSQKCGLALNNCTYWCSKAAQLSPSDQQVTTANNSCKNGPLRDAHQAHLVSLESQKQMAEGYLRQSRQVKNATTSPTLQAEAPPVSSFNRNGTLRYDSGRGVASGAAAKFGEDRMANDRGQEDPRSGIGVVGGIKVPF